MQPSVSQNPSAAPGLPSAIEETDPEAKITFVANNPIINRHKENAKTIRADLKPRQSVQREILEHDAHYYTRRGKPCFPPRLLGHNAPMVGPTELRFVRKHSNSPIRRRTNTSFTKPNKLPNPSENERPHEHILGNECGVVSCSIDIHPSTENDAQSR